MAGSESLMASDPLLQLVGLTKTYPGVVANSDVSLSVAAGEIHALLGENGAGKSTLVRMIYGLARPDAGEMRLRGRPYAPASPADARRQGVAMVFQHFSLFEALTVVENVALGLDEVEPMKRLAARIRAVSRDYGLPLDPRRRIGDLSAGERQRVEITRCLLQNPRLLIMDEPTSVLAPQEVGILFRTLRKLRDEGVAILYISHKLEEIRALCDRATILRRGRVVASCTPHETPVARMAELMVGTAIRPPRPRAHAPRGTVLRVDGLSCPPASPFGTALSSVSFSVAGGSVLGIAGIAGNGQDELLQALAGEIRTAPPTVMLDGHPIGALGPRGRRRAGLVAAPEDRYGHAAVPGMTLIENGLLTGSVRRHLVRRRPIAGLIDWLGSRRFADDIIRAYDVRTPGAGAPARALSGGNLQKFLIGRELSQDARAIIINQPTWGVDAAAAAAIRQKILDCAAGGAAVVVISQELDELIEIADHLAVLNAGRLSPPRPTETLGRDEIGLMMGGAPA